MNLSFLVYLKDHIYRLFENSPLKFVDVRTPCRQKRVTRELRRHGYDVTLVYMLFVTSSFFKGKENKDNKAKNER